MTDMDSGVACHVQARLNVLGSASLQVRGCPVTPCGQVPLRLLALLALQGPVSREAAADLLWNGTTRQSLQSLRAALFKLRRALRDAPDVLMVTGETIGVNLQALEVDALMVPGGRALLTWWAGPLLAARQGRVTSAWLDWRDRMEARLLDAHMAALYDAAARDTAGQADAFMRRAQVLTREHAGQFTASSAVGNVLGRAQELAALRAAPGSVHVCGPRGAGRSSLVRAAYPDAAWFTPGLQDRPDLDWVGRALQCRRAVFDDTQSLPRWAWSLAADLHARGCQVVLISTGALPSAWHDLPVVPVGAVTPETLLRLAATLAPGCPASDLTLLPDLTGGLPGRAARLLRSGGTSMRALLRARLAQFSEDALRVLWVSGGPVADFASLRVHCSLHEQALRDALVALTEAGFWADGQATHPLAVDVAGDLLPWWSRQILRPDVAVRAS
ncbi:hypothetical protein GCM10010842_20630 [Deinococcus daejeonensis]|uniref:Transcriptional regulator, SARP family n=1 Tax=Deinococcus daejeonensis TaxID=1007098 RepID=A0ABQ2J210_9DEIO|nr:hypothetical protein GCM10010842_20630 [Deinococcus daejeonensis]